ncbi:cyclic pyranopterin monophosphate synthase MoaC [Agathobaculum desmolans]|uniref:cyclic pyranopterin monophosphate synthase MoaC n=1 Tax=Agathobaculum desmolans TaxID=39484 RepID=UPI0004E1345A|nr:cyclic pyranopterin monophosphate synthase MoaC [Agathobaculum desmolans]
MRHLQLSHLDQKGNAHMVNVGDKSITSRMAIAQAEILMKPETLDMICQGTMPKGDAFACARIAGIMAAKRTFELIPMCHPLPIESVSVDFKIEKPGRVYVKAALKCSWKTGIEMEALTAASVAALTVYDMCKAVDRGMKIQNICLVEKAGGKSGHYIRENMDE